MSMDPRKAIKDLGDTPGVVVRSEMIPMYGGMGVYLSVEPEALAYAPYQRASRGGPLYPAPAAALGCITLSYRAGELWVIDGQNRAKRLALVPRSERAVRHLEAQCYLQLTEAQEAEVFAVMNGLRRQLRAPELLNAQLWAGESKAEAMVGFVKGLGLEVARDSGTHSSPTRIRAVKALTDLFTTHSDVLEATLVTLRDVWPDDGRKWQHNILRGLASFLRRFGGHPNFNHATLLTQLRKHKTSDAFIEQLPPACRNTRIAVSEGVEVFVRLYNEGRRGDYLPGAHQLPAPPTVKAPIALAAD